MWNSWLRLSASPSPDTELARTKAARTNRDWEDRSPGRPMAPMPRLYVSSGRAGAKRFTGGSGDSCA